ncbi:MAG: SHOCT domain-containing protein [Clostridia bacterium]|nr:SHOCT domain-containing protein [Clostridia bacterium]
MATPIQSTIDFSAKEQLQELKTMLNEGLITKEDFDKKKKQILGL